MGKLEQFKIKNPYILIIIIIWFLLWFGIEIPLGWQISSSIQYTVTLGFNLYNTPEKIGYFWGEKTANGQIFWLDFPNIQNIISFICLSVLPFLVIFVLICAMFNLFDKEIPLIFYAIIIEICIGIGIIYTLFNIQTSILQSYQYNGQEQYIKDNFNLGFGIDVFIGIISLTIWILFNLKNKSTNQKSAPNIGNTAQKILQWEFFILSLLILMITTIHRIGSISFYYLKSTDFECFFWGFFKPETQIGFTFLEFITLNNLLPWITVIALFMTSVCFILIGLPMMKFQLLKKMFKISLWNILFVIIIWGINVIIFSITSIIQIGFVIFILIGIEIYLFIKYQILFRKKKN